MNENNHEIVDHMNEVTLGLNGVLAMIDMKHGSVDSVDLGDVSLAIDLLHGATEGLYQSEFSEPNIVDMEVQPGAIIKVNKINDEHIIIRNNVYKLIEVKDSNVKVWSHLGLLPEIGRVPHAEDITGSLSEGASLGTVMGSDFTFRTPYTDSIIDINTGGCIMVSDDKLLFSPVVIPSLGNPLDPRPIENASVSIDGVKWTHDGNEYCVDIDQATLDAVLDESPEDTIRRLIDFGDALRGDMLEELSKA